MRGQGVLDSLIEIFSGGNKELIELVQKHPSEHFPGVWDRVVDIYNLVLPIAFGLMIIWFLIDLAKKQMETGSQMNFQSLVKPLAGLLVGFVILSMGAAGDPDKTTVMEKVYNVGHGLVNDVVKEIDGEDSQGNDYAQYVQSNTGMYWTKEEEAEEVLERINDYTNPDFAEVVQVVDGSGEGQGVYEIVIDRGCSVIESLQYNISLFVPWLTTMISMLVAYFVIYGRVFEIYLRYALAPIGLSDMFVKGTESTGFTYLKQFLAIGLQGVFLILLFFVFNLAQGDILRDTAGGIGLTGRLAVSVAQIALISKTRGLSKEIVGVA